MSIAIKLNIVTVKDITGNIQRWLTEASLHKKYKIYA
jgi:hypothetical protein